MTLSRIVSTIKDGLPVLGLAAIVGVFGFSQFDPADAGLSLALALARVALLLFVCFLLGLAVQVHKHSKGSAR